MHRKPAAAAAAVPSDTSAPDPAVDGDGDGYSTVIFRDPFHNFATSALELSDSLDGDAAYSTVIVRQPATAAAASHDARDSLRPDPIEIPVSPNSAASAATPSVLFFYSSSTSDASSPASVLVSFAPEATDPFASPVCVEPYHPALPQAAAAPSSPPLSPVLCHTPSAASGDQPENSEQLADVSHAVAFVQNRRNLGTGKGKSRSISDPHSSVSANAHSTAPRKRSSTSGVQQQGLSLGRCLHPFFRALSVRPPPVVLTPRCVACRFGSISSACCEVNLDQRGLTESDIHDIAPVLLALSCLQSLKLSKNALGDAHMAALASVLRALPALQLMDLSDNCIGDAGAVAIARALASSISITNLDLSNNRIGDAGAAAIESCLFTNHSLVQLELLGNPIGAAAASGIGQALRVNRTIARSYSANSEGGSTLFLRAVREREEVIGLSGAVMAQQKEQLAAAEKEIAALREQLRSQRKASMDMAAELDRDLKSAMEDAKRQRLLVEELEGRLAQKGCGCCMM